MLGLELNILQMNKDIDARFAEFKRDLIILKPLVWSDLFVLKHLTIIYRV